MGRVLTNNVSLAVARELPGQAGTLPVAPAWKQIEPNDITSFGSEITTVARNPISADKQRRKGTITDLDSSVEIEADLTHDFIDDFIDGFILSVPVNQDLLFTQAEATATGYTVPALNASQASRLAAGTLVYARGYVNDANNGLKPIAVSAADTDIEIDVTGLTAEVAPSGAIVELAGVRPAQGDLVLTVTGASGSLTSTVLDFTTLGLTPGQSLHIGGLDVAQQFSGDVAGFARVISVSTNELVLDKLGSALVSAAGAGDTVDLLFGRFIRNVPVTSTEYVEQPYQFELTEPNLGPSGETRWEYAEGNVANEITFELPLTEKATASVGFIGTDTKPPTDTQKLNADTPRTSIKTAAMNTSSDIGRLRVQNVDESGLTTDFKSISLTLGNNTSPEKVLGNLGARFINTGNFDVNFETQVLFTNEDVIGAIRENRTLTFDVALINDDGAFVLDIPSLTLGGGDREFPENETVLVNLEGEAFRDPVLNTSIGVSLIPIVPRTDAAVY